MNWKLLKNCLGLFCISLFLPHVSAQNGLAFDGFNDYVQTTSPGVSGANPRTIEAWIKTTVVANPSAGGVQQIIVDWGTQTTGARFTFNVLWGNAIRLEVSGSGLSGTIPVNDGLWHHVAGVYDPTSINPFSLYVDGALDVAGNITTPVNTSPGNLRIGRRVDDQRQFNGTIDEVRLWNYAKTQTEIQNGMNNELCAAQAGLLAYYKFNQGTAGGMNTGLTTVPDVSGAGNSGTLSNFLLSGSISNWVAGATLGAGTPTTGTLNVSSCDDYVSPSGNYVWNTSGTYTDTIANTAGCDSIMTVNLIIVPPLSDTISPVACGTYISPSGNNIWTMSGTYFDTLQNSVGCDSFLTINLTVNPNTTATISPVSCGSYTAPSGTQTWITSGTYQDIIPNSTGCDSAITINLTISGTTSETIFVTECDSAVSPSGNYVWTTSGTYRDTLTNAAGCDSLMIIGVEIGNSTSAVIDTSTCGPYLSPSGNYTWAMSGIYLDTIPNSEGCFEYLTINLGVTTIDTSVTQTGQSLSANAAGLAYEWLDCNDGFAFIFPEFNQQFNPTSAGSYAVQITQNGCIDTSSCHTVTSGVGIDANTFGHPVRVYPNPSSDLFYLELGKRYTQVTIQVHDLYGKQVYETYLPETEGLQISLGDQPQGTYLLTVSSEEKRAVKKLTRW